MEVEEFLRALDRVERYIRYLDMRASGHTYIAWGLAVAGASLCTFFAPAIGKAVGIPAGPIIGLSWLIAMTIAIVMSTRGMARLRAFVLAHRPREEHEELVRTWRRAGMIIAIGWLSVLSLWGFLFGVLFGESPGLLWSSYLICVGFGNVVIYLAPGEKEREVLYVAISLMAASPIPALLAIALPGSAGWAPFFVAIVAVIASYLWAGLRFYGRAEAILAGREG